MNRADVRKLLKTTDTVSGNVPQPFVRYATLDGATYYEDGKINANSNWTNTGVSYLIQPTGTEVLRLTGANFLFTQGAPFRFDGYCDGGALVEGIKYKLSVQSAATYYPLNGGSHSTTMHTFGDWLRLADSWQMATAQSGPNICVVRMNFIKQLGQPLRVAASDTLTIYLGKGDYSGFTEQKFTFTGFYESY